MSWGIIAGATIGAVASSSSSKSADKTIERTSDASNQLIADQFDRTEANLSPFIEGASGAFQLQQAQSGALGPEAQRQAFADFNESPGVAFMRERGLRNIDRNAARPGGGGLVGGNRDKANIAFSQGLAQQDFSNQFNRAGAVTGTGLTAAQALGGVAGAAAQGQANTINTAGSIMAQNQINRGNTFASAFGDIGAVYAARKADQE